MNTTNVGIPNYYYYFIFVVEHLIRLSSRDKYHTWPFSLWDITTWYVEEHFIWYSSEISTTIIFVVEHLIRHSSRDKYHTWPSSHGILLFGMSRNISFDIRQGSVLLLYSSWNISFDIRREISTIHGLPAMGYYYLVCRSSHLTFVRDNTYLDVTRTCSTFCIWLFMEQKT